MHQRILSLPRQHSLLQPPVVNPFVHEIELSLEDKIKIALLSIVLLPIRLLCMTCCLLLAWPFMILATLCLSEKETEPITGWKRSIGNCILSSVGSAFFFSMGFRVKVKGKIADPVEAPILVVAPHSTFFDAIVCIKAGLCSVVSRTENTNVPIFGRLLRCCQPVLVSRLDPDSRKTTITEITKRATSKGRWPQVLIFPEGTCTNRSCLITFKQGAFIPGVPVQPVLIRYPNKLDTVTWTWQGYTAKGLLFLTLCQFYTNLEIEFLPPHVPSEEEKNDPHLFANRVRNTMAKALSLPVTDHTFEDCRLMISAGQLTLPMEAGLVEFTKISKKLNLKWANVRKELDDFATIANASKGGRIGIEEFAKNLKLPVSDVLKELFALFDRLFDLDEDGYITEEEFSSLLCSALGVPDLDVSNLFKEINTDKSGKISYTQFKHFALQHPEYAKLFTTYLELQRYNALQDDGEVGPLTSVNKVHPFSLEDLSEDSSSSSDKKED
nr:PREDICTED: lysophosphatidylcholine acyltransferase 2 [Latimeria chalumnae]|eukprot:XP_006000313.1 PREDICTED: lysophosphatidylcholine acyltransferase 2 [Latimeria chalumnae]